MCHLPAGTRRQGRRRRAAHARACPRSRARASPARSVKPRPSSLTASSMPSASRVERARGSGPPRVLGGVRERLLRHAVGDELHVHGHVRELPGSLEARRLSRFFAQLVDQRRERGLEAEVVERGGPQGAGQRQQLLHRLVRQRLGLGQLARELGRRRARAAASRRSSSPVSDWLTSSWRSRATRARSSSWARSATVAGPPALGLEALEHPAEGAVQALRPPPGRPIVLELAQVRARPARGRPAPSRRPGARGGGTGAGA